MGHPARFTDSILIEALRMLREHHISPPASVLDPFAGTGKGVDFLCVHGYDTVGIDLEPVKDWGNGGSPRVFRGNATDLPVDDNDFDVVFTSPTYGNRFADRDMRKSCAGTYMKGLQREASVGSSCHLQWGPKYQELHLLAWSEARRVLKHRGHLLLNISDHYRDKKPQAVSAWHIEALTALGFEWVDAKSVPTPRMKNGANAQYRCEVEWLHLFKLVA